MDYYKGLKIVDVDGNVYKINSAKKIKGVGLFWGYNVFLNQKIKVELSFSDKFEKISLEDLKANLSAFDVSTEPLVKQLKTTEELLKETIAERKRQEKYCWEKATRKILDYIKKEIG